MNRLLFSQFLSFPQTFPLKTASVFQFRMCEIMRHTGIDLRAVLLGKNAANLCKLRRQSACVSQVLNSLHDLVSGLIDGVQIVVNFNSHGRYLQSDYLENVICGLHNTAETGGMSRDNIVKKFGRHVRKIREAKGINQTVLAERIGTEQSKISLMENGKQEPRLTFIHEIAGALRISLGELFKDL